MDKKIALDFVCDRNWDDMGELDQSTRFCSQCSKNIVDYSKAKQPVAKSECGRFSLSQLDSLRRQFTFRNLSSVAMSMLSVLGATVVTNELHGQESAEQVWQSQQQLGKVKLAGIIKDKETNQLMPQTKVAVLQGESVISRAVTDEEGKFSLEIETHASKLEDLKIVFSQVGYQNDTIQSFVLPHELINREVVVSIDAMLELEPIEIVGKKQKSDQYTITGLVRRSPQKPLVVNGEDKD